MSVTRPKGTAAKGFVPSKRNARLKKGDSVTPVVSEVSGGDKKQTVDVNLDDDKEGGVEFSEDVRFEVIDRTDEIVGDVGELLLLDETVNVIENSQPNISIIDEDVEVLELKEDIPYNGGVGIVEDSEEGLLDRAEIDENVKDTNTDTLDEITEEAVEESRTANDDRIKEEASRLLKLELEENQRQQEIERIAEEKLSQGTKLFVYPPVVKPDQDIEVFLNKSLSALSDEPQILIMGAFNDWKWKSFSVKLNKTRLKGDWWSCQLYVPREAYQVDFVFFNGQNVYDNNDQKDFRIAIEGGMDASAFENFLLDEKRKELEELARVQAERERQAEEQRRIEADRAAKAEDRSRARVEVQRMQETLPQLLKNAVKSIDNVWYIEPSDFKGKDLIRLYYNRSSGPLVHANEIWIHGGHNNWKYGLSIIERLVKSVLKGGDWWYADGMLFYISMLCLCSYFISSKIIFYYILKKMMNRKKSAIM